MTAKSSTQPSGGLLNKFRKAYRWYKEHNPSSETESDESDDELESENDGRKMDQEGTSSQSLEPRVKSASLESEPKKRSSMSKNDYLRVPTDEKDSPIDLLHPDSNGKPKYAPIIYRRRSSVALTK